MTSVEDLQISDTPLTNSASSGRGDRLLFSTMIRHALVAIAITLAVCDQASGQQSPFKPPSNLKVLPADAKLGEIIPVMRGFTQALGVRCQFCHSYSGTDPSALENFDFPADTVPAKATARKMMTAVKSINDDLLKGVGAPSPNGQSKVTCYTCHRGERTPLTAAPPR